LTQALADKEDRMAIREDWHGRYYEDFEIGDVYQHRLGRTISEVDNTWFTLLTLNTNQMHFNADYAKRSTFGKLLVNSGYTIGLVLGMSVSDLSENAIANLQMDGIKLAHPVFVGDTLYAESKVIGKRETKSRPFAGIVTVRTRGLNQDGDVCLSYKRTFMVYKRDATQDKGIFPEAKEPFPED
jgi:itaconyl-CoA hydratase